MYGFCSVKEPQAALPKYVLVNWVGEDVADARKCACASHVAKVAEFFQGVDVIVNASSVEDVDPGAIGQRLSNGLARVASPVLHRLRLREEENAEPVGTTYQKTDAAVEMKRLNREQFWEQAKKEEELRKEEERQKVLEERLRFEQERMEQERVEQEERERRYREREEQIEEHRRKQQTLEEEEARQRLQQPSIFGEQPPEEDQQLKKSESEVEEAAAIIAQRPDNPREFFKQQERVATGSSDATSPFSHRTGRLHCPFIKAPDSGPPSSSSSSSSPPRTPFPYGLCHRTPNLSSFFPCSQSDTHRKASAVGCSPCDSSLASTPAGEQTERALADGMQPAPQKDSPGPSSEGPAAADKPWAFDEPPGGPAWTAAQGAGLGPTEDLVFLEPVAALPAEAESPGPTQPPGPSPETLLDLWQNASAAPSLPASWELPTPAPLLLEVAEPPAAPAPPDDNLLDFNELPEPPATFCDAEQAPELASLMASEGAHPEPLGYQQEASGQPAEPPLLTNGEMAQKEGMQASEGYFSQSQDEEFGPVEPAAKTSPAVFYAKPPEIDITCWDADPLPEDEESYGP
ncbi:drebrin isoform X4 [Pelodiscus sinensis]|uniref:drebrin isoform X4 n=1 Tax=Pelodiscus sinensis TaxID=13735 RepID=UPI003F6BC127